MFHKKSPPENQDGILFKHEKKLDNSINSFALFENSIQICIKFLCFATHLINISIKKIIISPRKFTCV